MDLLSYTESCGLQPVLIDVQSMGGELEAMIYTYGELREQRVDTHVGYSVASSAVLLLLAGERRTMSRHGYILLHEVTMYTEGDTHFNYAREIAEGIHIVRDDYIRLVAERTGQSVEVITELVRNHTYLNAKEALALGFVTEIVD
jgi:ATP-dependent protease ClpP protease subunit